MRLIDADKLFSLIKEQKVKETGAYTRGLNAGLNIAKSIICDETRIPTAYDVDKVVEQLRQQAEQYHNRAERYAVLGLTREVEHMAGKAASYEHAIEIVKGGGVDAKTDSEIC